MTHDLAASGLRFGIEEEFFLLDASDLDIVRSAPAGFIAACRDTLGEHFAEEMFECQVEVASPVFSTLAEAARFHGQARQRLAHLAMDFGLRSLCVGTIPSPTGGGREATRRRTSPACSRTRAGGPAQPGLRPARACGDTAEPRPHGRAPARVAVAAAAAGVERILAVPRRPAQRPGELSTGTLRRMAEDEHSSCLARRGRLSPPPGAAARDRLHPRGWPGLVDDPAVIPRADPGAAYLRRLPAPGRRAEPGRAVQGAGGRRALGAEPRALPVARDACLEENYWQALRYGCAGRYLVEGRCVGAGDWLEMAWRQCRPQARQGNEWAYEHARGLLGETSASRQLQRYQTPSAAGQNGMWRCAGWWKNCWRRISSRPWPASAPFIIPFILGYTACSYYVFSRQERRCRLSPSRAASGTGAPDPRRTAGTGEEQGELVVKDFAHPAYRLRSLARDRGRLRMVMFSCGLTWLLNCKVTSWVSSMETRQS